MATPKLRFKEFEGDLTESKLVELTLWASGGTPAKDIPEYWGDDIPLISGASMHTSQLYESDVKITRLGLQKGSKLAPKDSILILVRGSMLFNKIPMGITLGDVAFNQDVKCIRPKQELAPLFLFQWLHAKENTIQNKVTATGIGAGKLDTADLQNLKLYKPSSEEQTKIASFLSTVDEKISQLTQKHQLLSQYKQGMMQKLFSQQLRFKADNGSEFGAWKHCKLKDVLISYRLGGNYSNAEMVTSYPLIKMGNLGRGSINLDKIEYIPEDQIIDPKDLIKKNDLFFNTRNTLDLVGKVALWRGELPIAYYNSNLLRLDFENNIFMNYLFNEQKTLEKLKAIASGTTSVAAIYTKDLLKINLEIPCLEEQNKIASFLSSIDQKIEVVAQQIEQAKTWKKGLLQQMFV